MGEIYQTLRSVSDLHLFVVCKDGEFYSLPEHVHHRGPCLIDLEEQGCELAVFR